MEIGAATGQSPRVQIETRGGHSPQLGGYASTQMPGRGISAPEDDSDGNDTGRVRSTLTLVALFIALVVLLASWSWLMMKGAN